jgi:undecaprenyl-phosphate galactose phosphotransferase/putative colanic acid biosynthesis UDP-glucose lipid carrier transferase
MLGNPVRPSAPSTYSQRDARLAEALAKRTFDVTFAATILFLLAPLLIAIAMAVFLGDGGPVLFAQERTGVGGRKFRIYKFRSMKVAAHADRRSGPTASHAGSKVLPQAVLGDERVTKVGAVLRRLSWDELPQLWNILRGDMSIVGPRPHAVVHDELWSRLVPDYAGRFRVRPGLTGFAQVRGLRGEVAGVGDIASRVAADNFYIDNWTLWLDLKIIVSTVPLLFSDSRAY